MLKPNHPVPGHAPYNDQHPTAHYFESIETGVGNYTWTALFDFDSDEIGDVLHGVLIVEPMRLDGDELVAVERVEEWRLLEIVSVTWWEGR